MDRTIFAQNQAIVAGALLRARAPIASGSRSSVRHTA